jgi:hypothetical protein
MMRPQLEQLEARCVPAQVLLGNILKETFDDPASFTSFVNGQLQGSSFDDIGRVTTIDAVTGAASYQLTHPVFHHQFVQASSVFLQSSTAPIGTTVPTAPQDLAGDLFFSHGTDTITFPDINNATEGVAFAAIDVQRDSTPVAVDFIADNGTVTLTTAAVAPSSPGTVVGATSPNPSGPGYSVIVFGPPPRKGWDTLVVGATDAQANGTPLGMIQSIVVHGHSETEIDNLRVVIFPRTPTNFTINPVNVTAEPGVPKLINVLQNDQFGGNPSVAVGNVSGALLGTPVVTGGAFVTYTARPSTHGQDSFTYTVVNDQGPIVDAQGHAAFGTVNVLVNTPPAAPLLTMTVPHGTAATFTGQITVPPDADGDPLTITRFADGNFGTVTITPTGSFTYTRTDGGVILQDVFFYQVSDGFQTAVGRVQLVPDTRPLDNPVDDPVPLADGYHGPVTINVLANDPYPRPDGSTPVGPFGDALRLVIVGQPSSGTARINADNTITYTPLPDPNGPVLDDSFTYELVDRLYGTESDLATVHLISTNQAPTAANLDFLLGHPAIGHAFLIAPFSGRAEPVDPLLAANGNGNNVTPTPATDAEGDSLHVDGVGPAAGGQVQVISPTEILYTPSATTIDDTFTYSVADQYGGAGTGTIHLHWFNDPPVATVSTIIYHVSSVGNRPVLLTNLLGGPPRFLDSDGDPISFKLLASTTPLPGTLGQYDPNATGRVVDFDPASGAFHFQPFVSQGTYSFTIAGTDGYADSAPVTVVIQVVDAPVSFILSKLNVTDELLVAGSPINLTVDLEQVGAIYGTVDLSLGALPPGVTASRIPSSVQPTTDITFTLTADLNAPPIVTDRFPVTVTAASGTSSQTAGWTFRLLPPNSIGIDSSTGDLIGVHGDSGDLFAGAGFPAGVTPPPPPPGVSAPEGFFNFLVGPLAEGAATTVTLYLPPGVVVTDYFKFGPTGVDAQRHPLPSQWYDFTMGNPILPPGVGAETHATNPAIPANEVVLHFVDGALGDDDLWANGSITDPGGPVFVAPVAAISDSGTSVRGKRQTFTVSASDAAARGAAGFSYAIDWGDGNPVQIVPRVPGNGSGVPLDHAFATTGTFTVKVTATDANGIVSNSATTTVTVTDPPVSATGGLTVTATEGSDPASQAVATFTDPGGAEPVGYYSATIAWGDGSSSAGVSTFDPNTQQFTVSGHHAYAEEGSYPVAVTIQDGSSPNVTVSSTAIVADAPLSAVPVTHNAIAGGPFSGAVATFTDADPNGTLGDYTATVLWGDGTTSVGVIALSGGGYTVSGSHTYAAAGKYTATVQIQDSGGSLVADLSPAVVTDLGQRVDEGLTADAGFWRNKRGQALINSFGGGGMSTALADWLAATFPNLYGVGAGANNLTGRTNASVAAFYQSLFDRSRPKLDAQTLGLALDVYATTLSLGGTAGRAYGFQVTAYGLGAYSFGVGHGGRAFDVADHTVLNVYQILRGIDGKAVHGVLFGGDRTLQLLAFSVIERLDDAGEID